jgi:WD40 repeat protein
VSETHPAAQATERRLPGTPFVGLVPYGEGDAAFFFGRDEEKQIVSGNLRAARLTILYGSSGVGKTSLLHAGVVHELHEQVRANASGRPVRTPFAICAFSAWRSDPLAGLAEAMRAAASEALGGAELAPWRPGEPLIEAVRAWTDRVRPLLVVLDQFEDYFLYHPAEDGEGSFAVEFPRLVNEPNLHVSFMLSIREDAWAKLDRFEGRIPALFANYVRVEHLGRDAAREAIEGPVGEWNHRLPPGEEPYTVEPALVDAVIDAAAAGSLGQADGAAPDAADGDGIEAPFLQLVMERLWRATVEAGGRTLDLARLDALGGAQQIVENHLLEALGKLTTEEQAVAADLFRFLVTRSKTKIAHPASDLAEWTERPEREVAAVLEKLCRGESGRILRPVSPPGGVGEMGYELFHDVLGEPIVEWRKQFEQRRELEADAKRQRVVRRRLVAIGGVLLTLVAVFAALTVWALKKSSDARRATASATSVALASAADNQLTSHFDASLLLGLEAYRARATAQASSSILSALEAARRSGAQTILRADQGAVTGVAFSPDGQTLASAGADGSVVLWDVRTRTRIGEPLEGHIGPIVAIAFSPDGRTLAAGNSPEDTGDAADARVVLWNTHTHKRLGRPLRCPQASLGGIAFGPHGQTLATAGSSDDGDGTVVLWNVRTHHHGPPMNGHQGGLAGVAFSKDGHMLASVSYSDGADGTNGSVLLWSLPGATPRGKPFGTHHGDYNGVAFNPDGDTIATAGFDGAVRLWNTTTHAEVGPPLKGARGATNGIAFSRYGRTLATAGNRGTVWLWDVRTHKPRAQPLDGRQGGVTGVAFSRDGVLASAGRDGTVRLWSSSPQRELGQALQGTVGTFRFDNVVTFSPDGRTLVGASSDGTLRTWDMRRARTDVGRAISRAPKAPGKHCTVTDSGASLCLGADVIHLPDGAKWAVGAAYTADGRTLVTADQSGAVRLRDASSHLRQRLRIPGDWFFAVSPDGSMLATANEGDNATRLWDLRTHTQVVRLRESALSASFSPDGHILATAGVDGTVRLWDTRTYASLGRLRAGDTTSVSSIAFSPDGSVLAVGSVDGLIRFWDVEAQTQLGRPLRGHSAAVSSLAFSPDGGTLASGSVDTTVRLWSVQTHIKLGQPLRGFTDTVDSIAFSPDGRTLAASGHGGTVRLWEGILWHDGKDLKAQVCRLVVGNLTRSEWDTYAPGLSYRTTCPD